jgi:hypothetical protein
VTSRKDSSEQTAWHLKELARSAGPIPSGELTRILTDFCVKDKADVRYAKSRALRISSTQAAVARRCGEEPPEGGEHASKWLSDRFAPLIISQPDFLTEVLSGFAAKITDKLAAPRFVPDFRLSVAFETLLTVGHLDIRRGVTTGGESDHRARGFLSGWHQRAAIRRTYHRTRSASARGRESALWQKE